MKTAMQELIDKLDKTLVKSIFERLEKDDIFNKALQKEKEQIIDAYCEGFKEGSEGNRIMPEEYYYDLYNQFIKKITITEFNQKQHIIDIMKSDEDDVLYNENK